MEISLFGPNVHKSASVPDSYNMACPFCPIVIGKEDKGMHLNFNTAKHVFRCPRCLSAGSLSNLKEFSFISKAPKTISDIKLRAEKLFERSKPTLFDINKISWPLNIEKTPIAYKYITIRGFTDDDIKKYSLRVGIPYYDDVKDYEVKKWSGRILFPFINKSGEYKYVVGRTYIDSEPRYLNSEGSRSTVLYNIENINGACILCEGIISSISAEKATKVPAVALLGKSMNSFQISLLKSRTSEVFLSLDGDTSIKEREFIKTNLQRAGIKVWMIDVPIIKDGDKIRKDPDDHKESYLEIFKKARSTTPFRTPSKTLREPATEKSLSLVGTRAKTLK